MIIKRDNCSNSNFHFVRTLLVCVQTIVQNVPRYLYIIYSKSVTRFTLKQNMTQSSVVIAAAVKHTATIIFLHGLGDTGHGWSQEIEAIREPYMKIICPTADTAPVTLNGFAEMPSWFDIEGLTSDATEDINGIKRAAKYVHDLIDEEIAAGIPSDRIIVGGFSQGGGLALYSGLTCSKKLAGIVALSCWLPAYEPSVLPSLVTANRDIHILQCHGDADNVVHFTYGQVTTSHLKEFSENVVFRRYSGLMHSTSEEELNDIQNFLKSRLPPI